MNNYFSSIVSNVNLKLNQINNSEKLGNIIKTSKNHQRVERIKVDNSNETKTFDFSHVTVEKIKNKMLHLSSDKSTRKGDIPAKVLKDSITYMVNNSLL